MSAEGKFKVKRETENGI